MNNKILNTKFLLKASVIGAIYGVLTIVLGPVSFGPLQIRISEALTILPAFTPAAVPGLFAGCVVANLVSPYGIIDVICGSMATLFAAWLSYLLRNRWWLVPLPPVVVNAVVIGGMLHFAYGVPNLPACMGWIALGQIGACYVLGSPLLKLLDRHSEIFR